MPKPFPRIPHDPAPFIEWAEQQAVLDGSACPLERYLIAQGATRAWVDRDGYEVIAERGSSYFTLPQWVPTFMLRVDLAYFGHVNGDYGYRITGEQAAQVASRPEVSS